MTGCDSGPEMPAITGKWGAGGAYRPATCIGWPTGHGCQQVGQLHPLPPVAADGLKAVMRTDQVPHDRPGFGQHPAGISLLPLQGREIPAVLVGW